VASGSFAGSSKSKHSEIRRGPTELVGPRTTLQHAPTNLDDLGKTRDRNPGSGSWAAASVDRPAASALPAAQEAPGADASSPPVSMRLLVVSADGNETDFPAVKAFLDQIGVPYTVLIATQTPLTPELLSDGSRGFYQGVVLVTGNLTYESSPGVWVSAFEADEWQTLWEYEAMYDVRQVTSYTYPYGLPDDYGLDLVTYQDTLYEPLQAGLTDAGKAVFSYVNTSSPITFKGAWVYLATARDATVTPLITTNEGYTIASLNRYADGRENLAVTAANNPFLVHSQLLSYGLINWVTRGVFLGERHVSVGAQVDDLLIDSDMWDVVADSDLTGLTFRMNATDFEAAAAWQSRLASSSPNLADFKLEMGYNGEGATGIYSDDTLTPAVKAGEGAFAWVNHTYSHEPLDTVDYATAQREITTNNRAARTLGLDAYFKDALVQPDISGLGNPAFLQAAVDVGLRYLISDTSRAEWNNPSPNAGFYSTYQPSILIIPRRPTNLFYNLRAPEELVDEYNYYYGPGGVWAYWDRPLTYAEILDKESDVLLSYLLRWDLDPWMFHQANLGRYDGQHSLLGDLLDATMSKYLAVYNLPVRALPEHTIGLLMARRMAYNASGVEGVLTPCEGITLSVSRSAAVPVTGVSVRKAEKYGGQPISTVQVDPGTPVSLRLSC